MIHNFAVNNYEEMQKEVDYLVNNSIYKEQDIAIMPDAHLGKNHASVGFTSTYTDKIIPNTVGVDLGCRVSAYNLGDIDIDFQQLDKIIHDKIPSGTSIHVKEPDESKVFPYEQLRCWQAIKDNEDRYRRSMGTLGGGNHFISIECAANGDKYLLIHCGSRNLGLQIANYYQQQAIAARDTRINDICNYYEKLITMARNFKNYDIIQTYISRRKKDIAAEVPDEFCYVSGQDMDDYLHDSDMMLYWVSLNHQTIAHNIMDSLGVQSKGSIQCSHNYIDSIHGVIRKGAIAAYKDDLCLIPLNMADGTLIVRAKGNPDWGYSLPHGAGRILSRAAARKEIDMADYEKSMEGIYSSSVCSATVDEAPQSYKHADEIIAAIGDNAEIVEHLRPVYNFKAKG